MVAIQDTANTIHKELKCQADSHVKIAVFADYAQDRQRHVYKLHGRRRQHKTCRKGRGLILKKRLYPRSIGHGSGVEEKRFNVAVKEVTSHIAGNSCFTGADEA